MTFDSFKTNSWTANSIFIFVFLRLLEYSDIDFGIEEADLTYMLMEIGAAVSALYGRIKADKKWLPPFLGWLARGGK